MGEPTPLICMSKCRLTVIFRPPPEVTPADDMLGYKANYGPWDIVERSRWGYPPGAIYDDGDTVALH